jgi:hypothetical protein
MSFLPDGNEPRAGSALMDGMNPCACTVFHERPVSFDFRPMLGGGEYDGGSVPRSWSARREKLEDVALR